MSGLTELSSESSGHWSGDRGSALDLIPGGAELLPSGRKGLGKNPRVGDGRHKVRIGVPSRQNVCVKMRRNSCARRGAEIEPDVHAWRTVRAFESPDRLADCLPQTDLLFIGQIIDVAEMPNGHYKHMAASVWIGIEKYRGCVIAPNKIGLTVRQTRREQFAEHATSA